MAPRSTMQVEIEPGPVAEDGLSLRFRAIDPPVELGAVAFEDDDGRDGLWDVLAVDDVAGERTRRATTARVEDSSDGTARLVAGGVQGLLLTHRASGTTRREPYLLLTADAHVEP